MRGTFYLRAGVKRPHGGFLLHKVNDPHCLYACTCVRVVGEVQIPAEPPDRRRDQRDPRRTPRLARRTAGRPRHRLPRRLAGQPRTTGGHLADNHAAARDVRRGGATRGGRRVLRVERHRSVHEGFAEGRRRSQGGLPRYQLLDRERARRRRVGGAAAVAARNDGGHGRAEADHVPAAGRYPAGGGCGVGAAVRRAEGSQQRLRAQPGGGERGVAEAGRRRRTAEPAGQGDRGGGVAVRPPAGRHRASAGCRQSARRHGGCGRAARPEARPRGARRRGGAGVNTGNWAVTGMYQLA